MRMRESVRPIIKLAHFWSYTRWFPPLRLRYTLLHDVKGAREKVLNAIAPTSPPGAGGILARGVWRHMPYVYCAKNSTDGLPILENEHDKSKCTLFYCCFSHYWMLTYKISACEVCIIWRKPTEAFQNPLAIAESRTGKPAMVTLKIQLHCSTVYDTSLLANIYMRSHLGCGTDSVFIGLTNISEMQKWCK